MKKKNLKKRTALVLALLLFLAMATACGQTAESPVTNEQTTTAENSESDTAVIDSTETSTEESALLQKIKQQGYILIGSSNDAPFSYENIETGELDGLDIEILREICSRLGIPDIQMKVVDFANLLVELNNNNIDMVADAMYVREERLQIAAFTDKWYQQGEAVVIAEDSDIATKEDLVGKTVAAQPGTAFYEAAQKWLDEGSIGGLEAYDNQATLMTSVDMGKVDAVVTDGIVAGHTLSSDSSLKLKLLHPYEPEASGQIAAAVRFEDMDFLEEVNIVLNEMKEDGTLLSILEGFGLSEDYYVDVESGKTVNIK